MHVSSSWLTRFLRGFRAIVAKPDITRKLGFGPVCRLLIRNCWIPSTDFVLLQDCSNANQTTERSSMRTARPAARPPRPFFELRAQPFDMLPPCLIFLDGDGPADPLVARERRHVSQAASAFASDASAVRRSAGRLYDSSGDLNGCHRVDLPG